MQRTTRGCGEDATELKGQYKELELQDSPDGPTVQFTGTLIARSRFTLFLTRSPKYSSLRAQAHQAA